jgi:hypothetical protein
MYMTLSPNTCSYKPVNTVYLCKRLQILTQDQNRLYTYLIAILHTYYCSQWLYVKSSKSAGIWENALDKWQTVRKASYNVLVYVTPQNPFQFETNPTSWP